MTELSSGTSVLASDGIARTLGEAIKSGGAGTVYRVVGRPEEVVKIYHTDEDRRGYVPRLAAMLALRPSLPDLVESSIRYVQIAWPTALVKTSAGQDCGFVMPAVDVGATCELETMLQDRQALAAGLSIGLGTKITLAANLCGLVSALHAQGHYVVDLKPVNVRFYRRSLYIALLDCDGLSINAPPSRFHAPQFTPDYLAPEFQTTGIAEAGEEQQDRFALAVIVFQLLNFGLHPYAGVPREDRVPTDIAGRIRERCYPYGQSTHARIAPSPISSHDLLPSGLRMLFDRAFAHSDGRNRPSAAQWATTLQDYAQPSRKQLVSCTKDSAHQTFAGLACAACRRQTLLNAARAQAHAAGAINATGGTATPGKKKRKKGRGKHSPTPPQVPGQPVGQTIAPAQPRRWTPTVVQKPVRQRNPYSPAVPTTTRAGCLGIVLVAIVIGVVATLVEPGPKHHTPYEKPTQAASLSGALPGQTSRLTEAELRENIDAVVAALRAADADDLRTQLRAIERRNQRLPELEPAEREAHIRASRDIFGGRGVNLRALGDAYRANPSDFDTSLEYGLQSAYWTLLNTAKNSPDPDLRAMSLPGVAETALRRAVHAFPSDPRGWYALGLLKLGERNLEASMDFLTIAYFVVRVNTYRDRRSAFESLKTYAHILLQYPLRRDDIGIDGVKLEIIEAHAEVAAARLTGNPVPDDVVALANAPMPTFKTQSTSTKPSTTHD